ncbi:MAG: tRNA (adenine-N1)-methyltransferase [Candidatus Bathyarchaeota archaeon]|nr:MAG: tRNA (adenine-N1)-methyltransferase [Candidatus Bathyarchaeota archaeon]
MSTTINNGDYVLLYLDRRRTYLVKAEKEKSFHTHKGFIPLGELIGKEYGTRFKSSMNVEFVALKPILRDHIFKGLRKTQIMYPKDIALLVMFSAIGPGSSVVEAGTGTGALTTALAFYVKPNGRVYTYEVRQEFMKTASKNLERAGVLDFVELKNKNILDGIDERDVDAVILDLATPWLVVPYANSALRGSGILVSFSPTIDQVVKTVEAMKENMFTAIETIECLMRRMQAIRGKTRPETLMTGHTGYITFARKTLEEIKDWSDKLQDAEQSSSS